MSIEYFGEGPPSWLELESNVRMPVAEKITTLSADTLRRRYGKYVIKVSERRDAMKLRHTLEIAAGTIKPEV